MRAGKAISHIVADSKGTMIIFLIVAMLILSSFSLLMLSFTSSSTFSHIGTYAATKASYLAESGYRFFAGQYLAAADEVAKNNVLRNLNGSTHTLLDNEGQFALAIFPYYYQNVTARPTGAGSVTLRFPGTIPSNFDVRPVLNFGGWFGIGALGVFRPTGGYEILPYFGVSQNGENYTFTLLFTTLSSPLNVGTSVVPVCFSASQQTVTRGGALTLLNVNGTMPQEFGAFEISDDNIILPGFPSPPTGAWQRIYFYTTRTGNVLGNIQDYREPERNFTFTVQSLAPIPVHTTAIIQSTGTAIGRNSLFSRTAVLGFGLGGNSNSAVPPPGDTFVEQGEETQEVFDQNWTDVYDNASIVNTGPSEGPSIQFQGQVGVIGLNWETSSGVPNLLDAWNRNGANLLSYDLQVKVHVDFEGNKGEHYMEGISFRLDTATDSSYGLSYFRSIGRGDSHRPSWINSLPTSFNPIMDGYHYVILWAKVNGVYSLIQSRQLGIADGVIESGELKPWSTLVVRVDEQFSGPGGSRQNHIRAYIQGTDVYPREVDPADELLHWDFTQFRPLWNTDTSPIVDNRLTSVNFGTRRPEEIGLHAYYDANAANDQFFDDFTMQLTGTSAGSHGGMPGM